MSENGGQMFFIVRNLNRSFLHLSTIQYRAPYVRSISPSPVVGIYLIHSSIV